MEVKMAMAMFFKNFLRVIWCVVSRKSCGTVT